MWLGVCVCVCAGGGREQAEIHTRLGGKMQPDAGTAGPRRAGGGSAMLPPCQCARAHGPQACWHRAGTTGAGSTDPCAHACAHTCTCTGNIAPGEDKPEARGEQRGSQPQNAPPCVPGHPATCPIRVPKRPRGVASVVVQPARRQTRGARHARPHSGAGRGAGAVLGRGGDTGLMQRGSLCLLEQMGARSPASPAHWRTVPARQPSGSRAPRAPASASPAATATAPTAASK